MTAQKKRPKILALDLDGTLCEYDGWKGPAHFGKPFPEVLEQLYKLKREGKENGEEWAIMIFTTRRTDHALKAHLDKHNVPYDFINKHPWQPPNSSHKPFADVYLDDRAMRFTGNATGLAARIRAHAQPWFEKTARVGEVDNALVDVLQDEDFQKRAELGRSIMTPTGATDGREEEQQGRGDG
jgi:hypothetical protein